MSTQNRQRTKVRNVGSKKERTSEKFSPDQLAQLAVLFVAAISNRIPVYIGAQTTTGSIKLRFYDDDVPSQAYVNSLDDVWEEVLVIGREVFGEEALSDAVALMKLWRVERASEAPRNTNPSPTPEKANPKP